MHKNLVESLIERFYYDHSNLDWKECNAEYVRSIFHIVIAIKQKEENVEEHIINHYNRFW